MKINIEFKPKEWVWMALFVVIIILLVDGQVGRAVGLVASWIAKK